MGFGQGIPFKLKELDCCNYFFLKEIYMFVYMYLILLIVFRLGNLKCEQGKTYFVQSEIILLVENLSEIIAWWVEFNPCYR